MNLNNNRHYRTLELDKILERLANTPHVRMPEDPLWSLSRKPRSKWRRPS
jgi:hypothetical protein